MMVQNRPNRIGIVPLSSKISPPPPGIGIAIACIARLHQHRLFLLNPDRQETVPTHLRNSGHHPTRQRQRPQRQPARRTRRPRQERRAPARRPRPRRRLPRREPAAVPLIAQRGVPAPEHVRRERAGRDARERPGERLFGAKEGAREGQLGGVLAVQAAEDGRARVAQAEDYDREAGDV